MKMKLDVTFEWPEERGLMTMSVECDGTLLGQLALTAFGRSGDTAIREQRDAMSGVFLSSFNAAVSRLRDEIKERGR